MVTEIKAPQFPESVAEGTISQWHKQPGDFVEQDELLVDIETDKVVLEVVAPVAGTLEAVLKGDGVVVLSLEVIGHFSEGVGAAAASAGAAASATVTSATTADAPAQSFGDAPAGPAAKKLAMEKNIDLAKVPGSGKDGRVTKEDVTTFISSNVAASAGDSAAQTSMSQASAANTASSHASASARHEKRVPMTRLRARVAQRLMEAKNGTAMLTTFNEVNMAPLMDLRKQYKEAFQKRHNTKLGFMSFFVKASVEALKRFPAVNASIDGSDIVYHNFFDVGVAVSSDRGLVVPILRDADQQGFAAIENQIVEYGTKAKEGKLSLDDMTGGTFTISNGGVFGSLLSTPILNPPQTAILGMHTIKERPMAVDGQVVILPMMYLALSYDHRLIDGKEAVQFLVTIKDLIEDPSRMLLDV